MLKLKGTFMAALWKWHKEDSASVGGPTTTPTS